MKYPIQTWATLSKTEFKIACLVAQGMPDKVISAHTGMQYQVVKNYCRSLYKKLKILGVHDRVTLAVKAWR